MAESSFEAAKRVGETRYLMLKGEWSLAGPCTPSPVVDRLPCAVRPGELGDPGLPSRCSTLTGAGTWSSPSRGAAGTLRLDRAPVIPRTW